MPTPHPKTETQSEWMGRCVPYVVNEGKDQDQAVAQCLQMWRDANKGTSMTQPVKHPIRAYSLLNVKRVDTELRKIEGMATTPTTDRMGDIVEPDGVEFVNPL